MRKPPLVQRLRAKKDARARVVGVTWYTNEETWRKIKEESVDSDLFEPTYAEWVEMATTAVEEIRRGGTTVVRVAIVADELLAWCALHSKENNAASRAEYVAGQLRTNP